MYAPAVGAATETIDQRVHDGDRRVLPAEHAGGGRGGAQRVPKALLLLGDAVRQRARVRLSERAQRRRKEGATAEKASPGWAELLRRVFGVDGWQCPCCGKRMTLRTIVIGAPASTRIVSGLLHARAPPEGGGGDADRGA